MSKLLPSSKQNREKIFEETHEMDSQKAHDYVTVMIGKSHAEVLRTKSGEKTPYETETEEVEKDRKKFSVAVTKIVGVKRNKRD